MKKYYNIMRPIQRLVLSLLLLGSMVMSAHAAELISIKDVILMDDNFNDGDSFKVNAAGRELRLRLYYVDCLETAAHGIVKDRILQQQHYFALKNTGAVLDFGKQAARFTQRVLSKPFTIHTSYATALGINRYYAFVETADGDDLAQLLVAQGLARIHGITRPAPDGTPNSTILAELLNLRNAAMLKRTGIWSMTDPDRLVELGKPYNLNTATSEQLQQIPGIGSVLADRIISGRPYWSVQELLKVDGIGRKKLAIIVLYVTSDGE